MLLAALLAGAWLVAHGGRPILIIGACAIVAALAYSAGPFPLASRGFGEVLVFAFFGFAAVGGTHHLQGASFDWTVALAAYPIGALAAAIIVVNNLRDIDTDRRAGKQTLAVRLGVRRTRMEYSWLVLSALLSILALAAAVSPGTLIALLAIAPAMYQIECIWQRHGVELNLSLVGTARLHALVGVLIAVGLCV